jgi:hypothetical protein
MWSDAESWGRAGSDTRLVSYRLRTVSRSTKRRVDFAMPLDDARDEFEAQKGLRTGKDYAERA